MALGAFVAGLLLAETEFRKAIETAIDPFKGLLLGLFFFTVGMKIDFRELAREPVWLIGGAFGLIVVKAAILIVLARLYRLSWPASLEIGLLLGAGGEFAFVGIGMWFEGADRRIPAIGVPSASALAHRHYPAAAYNLFSIARDGNQWRCVQTVRGIDADFRVQQIKQVALT